MSFVGLIYVISSRSEQIAETFLRDGLRAEAALGATEIDAEDIRQVGEMDRDTPILRKLEAQVRAIRDNTPYAVSASIFRKTNDPNALTFVVASGMYEPDGDVNNNGRIDPAERRPVAGERYDISKQVILQEEAFVAPTVDRKFTTNLWGTYISGYAPILDAQGMPVAVLTIDIDATTFSLLTHSILPTIVLLLLSFSGVIVAGYMGMLTWEKKMKALEVEQLEAWNARLEAKVQERTKDLLDADKAKTTFINMTAHQLLTPITGLHAVLETLLEEQQKGSESERLMRAGSRRLDMLVQIIDTMRFYSHLERGDVRLQPERVRCGDMMQSLRERHNDACEAKDIRFTVNAPDDLWIVADRRVVQEIISVFLCNAIVYTPRGGSVDLAITTDDKWMVARVSDTGCGIPKEQYNKLFQKFFRADNAKQERPDGTGLGLYLAKELTTIVKGDIAFTSEVGKGTTFTVRLPIDASAMGLA